MNKATVNAKLKELGLGRVKISNGGWSHNSSKVYKDCMGKMVNGVFCSSYGPMTMTSIYRERANEIYHKLETAMSNLGLKKEEMGFVVSETSKSKTYLVLNEEWFPAYTMSANLDDGYKNIYIVPKYMQVKK